MTTVNAQAAGLFSIIMCSGDKAPLGAPDVGAEVVSIALNESERPTRCIIPPSVSTDTSEDTAAVVDVSGTRYAGPPNTTCTNIT
jgi:hypothetical protein